MVTRIPGSARTREELQALIDGRLASSDERSALLRVATRLIVEEALEAEVADALGRGYYEHGTAAGRPGPAPDRLVRSGSPGTARSRPRPHDPRPAATRAPLSLAALGSSREPLTAT
jgi:putative transposase